MRNVRRSIGALAVAAALGMTACGGDDGGGAGGAGGGGAGGGGSRLTDEAFCARLVELEEQTSQLDPDEADAAFFGQLSALVAAAPNDQLRSALSTFGDIAQKLEGIDENDPEAFGEAFAIFFDPKVIAASETLETYLTDTCGIDTGSGIGDDDLDVGEDFDVDFGDLDLDGLDLGDLDVEPGG